MSFVTNLSSIFFGEKIFNSRLNFSTQIFLTYAGILILIFFVNFALIIFQGGEENFLLKFFVVNFFVIASAIFFGKFFLKKFLKKNFYQQQRFISDASHEFRTPLTIIRGYADMLEKFGAEDKEIFFEATAAIKKSSQNMQDLIEKLLFLARAEENLLPLKKNSVDIAELLKSVVKNFNTARIEFSCKKNFEVVGDKIFLEKMFQEIIDNALTFSEEKIFVEVEKNFVTISDSGIGIVEENFEQIFEKFFKVDKSRTKTDAEKISAGLGLAIAKFISDSHKIKIKIDSKLNQGTKFILRF